MSEQVSQTSIVVYIQNRGYVKICEHSINHLRIDAYILG